VPPSIDSLELPPFSYIAGYRVLAFLRSALAP